MSEVRKIMEKELVSVVMAVYNTPPDMLGESMDSILNQTYKSMEFIIINDGTSRRSTLDKLFSYKDERIKIISNHENIGLTRSLIKGIKFCRGKYIARMDADDISMPERIEKQVTYLKETGYHAAGCYYKLIPERKFHRIYTEKNEQLRIRMIFENAGIIHSSAMWEREYFAELGLGYNRAYEKSQDYALWCDCVSKGLDIGIVPEYLVLWRESENQITRTHADEQRKFRNVIKKNYIKRNYRISDRDIRLFVRYIDLGLHERSRKKIVQADGILNRFINNNRQADSLIEKEICLYWMIQTFRRFRKRGRFTEMLISRMLLKILKPCNLYYCISVLMKQTVTVH